MPEGRHIFHKAASPNNSPPTLSAPPLLSQRCAHAPINVKCTLHGSDRKGLTINSALRIPTFTARLHLKLR